MPLTTYDYAPCNLCFMKPMPTNYAYELYDYETLCPMQTYDIYLATDNTYDQISSSMNLGILRE